MSFAQELPRWRFPLVERLRELRLSEWVVAAAAVVAAGASMGTILLWLTGAMANSSIIYARLATISEQITQLQSDMRAVPRADQIVVLDRHLSVQDGRMDGIDTRIRDLETHVARVQAQIESIEAASRATLGHR